MGREGGKAQEKGLAKYDRTSEGEGQSASDHGLGL